MSITPPPPGPFTDYYRQQIRPININMANVEPMAFPEREGQANKMGFLGRTVDILSRPLRLVTNPILKSLELQEKAKEFRERELAGEEISFGERVAPVGSLLAAPLTGFFSDDPENKPYWSDIIEKGNDVANLYNPQYEDVKDNVNPVVKGIAGFAGDVLLDPLTWIPGAAIAKGVQIATRGAKGATEAVSKAVQAAKGASTEVGEVAAQTAQAGARATGVETPIVKPNVSKAVKASEAMAKVSEDIPQATAKGLTSSETVIKSLSDFIKSKEPLRTQMVDWVKALKEAPEIVPPKVPKAAPKQTKLSPAQWLSATLKAVQKGDIEDLVVGPVRAGADTGATRKATYDDAVAELGRVNTLQDALTLYGRKAKTNPIIKDRLTETVFNPRFKGYLEGLKYKRPTDLLGRIIDDGKSVDEKVVESATALTALQRLNALEGEALAKAEALFGPELLNDIRKMQSKTFNKFLDDLQRVLDGDGVVPVFNQVNRNSIKARVLQLFDISPEMYSAARRGVDGKIDYVAVNGVESLKDVVNNLADSPTWQQAIRDEFLRAVPSYQQDVHIELATKALTNALNSTFPKLFDKEWVSKNYPNLLPDGTYKTDEEFAIGVARKLLENNEHAQYTVRKEISKEVDKIFAGVKSRDASGRILKTSDNKPIYDVDPLIRNKELGFALAAAKEQWVSALTKISDDLLYDKGVPSILSYEGNVVALRLSDIETILKKTYSELGIDRRWLQLLFYHGGTGAAWTKISDAVVKMLNGGTEDDVLRILVDNSRRNLVTDDTGKTMALLPDAGAEGKIDNWLAGPEVYSTFGHRPGKKPSPMDGVIYTPNKRKPGHFYEWSNKEAAARLGAALIEARPALEAVALARHQDNIARFGAEFERITPDVARELVEMFKTPDRAAEAIRATAFLGDMTKDYGRTIDAFNSSVMASAQILKNSIGDRVANIAKYLNDLAEGVSSANPSKVASSRAKLMNESDEVVEEYSQGVEKLVREGSEELDPQANEMLREVTEEVTENSKSRGYRKEQSQGRAEIIAGARSLVSPLGRMFNGRYGMNTKEYLWGWLTFHGQGLSLREFVNNRVFGLRELVKKHNSVLADGKTTVLQQAFRQIQSGTYGPQATRELSEAFNDLQKYVGLLFDLSGKPENTLLGNAFFRTGAGIQYINRILEQYRVLGDVEGVAKLPIGGVFFDIDKANDLIRTGRSNRSLLEEASEQWRTWEITDPIQFIGRMNAALGRVAAEVSFVEKFVNKASKYGLVSDKAGDGFVPLLGEGKTHFGDIVEGMNKPIFVQEDVAEMFRAIDQAAGESRNVSGGLANFVNKVLDPITNTWKYAITLPRPGHHVRNLVGDTTFTFLAEGVRNSRLAARDAFRVMGVRNNYQDVDIVRTLVADGVTAIPKGTDKIVSGKFGKEEWSLTADEILQAAKDRGLLPPSSVVEDLYDQDIIATKFSELLEKGAAVATLGAGARGGSAEKFVMGVSEYRDHFARLHHFIQILHNTTEGKKIVRGITNVVTPKTLEELLDVAAERVLKYHPDVSLLSAFEAKYMRRIIPFYSWTRGAVQALAESTVLNPGRITAINKASYNLAIAMGIDPNALYDPFPQDQLFPSFLTEEMQGPQWEVGGKYYGLSPGIATWDVYNMLGPDPIRGAVGSTNPLIRAPIELLAGSSLGTGARIRDYSDYVDSTIPGVNYISNVSGVSVAGTLASLLSGGGLDQQYQYAAGNKDNTDRAISALNWLTGIGLRNYSRPNYINFAEIEMRNRAAEEANR